MPLVSYRLASGAKLDHLSALESFLDSNHEEIPRSLHGQLLDIYEDMNEQAGKAWDEFENQFEEMTKEIEALKERVEELEDAND